MAGVCVKCYHPEVQPAQAACIAAGQGGGGKGRTKKGRGGKGRQSLPQLMMWKRRCTHIKAVLLTLPMSFVRSK